MAMEVNGPAILDTLLKDPAVFLITKSQINSLAQMVVVASLKSKDLKLAAVQTLSSKIGKSDFALILDNLKPTELKALSKKLDAYHENINSADSSWYRTHIADLAGGASEPIAPSIRKPKRAAAKLTVSKTPKIGKIMSSEVQKGGGRRTKQKTA